MSDSAKDRLHNQLIKLGDMIGDGLADEPGGAWIKKEYRNVCRALGYLPKPKRNTVQVNEKMAQRVKEFKCQKCDGELKQTRSGSLRAACTRCGSKYQLLKRVRSQQ